MKLSRLYAMLLVFAFLFHLPPVARGQAPGQQQQQQQQQAPMKPKSDSTCTAAETQAAVKDPKHLVPLSYLIPCVEQLLAEANKQLAADQELLKKDSPKSAPYPPLSTAEFDFQGVTTSDATGNLTILSVFTAGAERKSKATQETDITYSVPTPPAAHGGMLEAHSAVGDWFRRLINDWKAPHGEARSLDKTLPDAIVSAIKEVEQYPTVTGGGGELLSHRKIVISIAFEVDSSFNTDLDFSKLTIVGPKATYSRESDNTQTLKLTFEDKSS
ncbi:hypothetical protein FTO74_08645 [Granulicella sp. WH15]|uniref:hypothetical protein n=1 Tax=Granulicella sp. WH15 TaxID=2602070 RepID=UPI001366B216|nr:hypothetical protein [Granulicella sp. WH15]QHN03424.1 hypothetical protein FTO74_08645 [Granulicella sp. WH15]